MLPAEWKRCPQRLRRNTVDGRRGRLAWESANRQQPSRRAVARKPGTGRRPGPGHHAAWSGTDGLAGIAGRMAIEITDGKHSYIFDYSIEEIAAG